MHPGCHDDNDNCNHNNSRFLTPDSSFLFLLLIIMMNHNNTYNNNHHHLHGSFTSLHFISAKCESATLSVFCRSALSTIRRRADCFVKLCKLQKAERTHGTFTLTWHVNTDGKGLVQMVRICTDGTDGMNGMDGTDGKDWYRWYGYVRMVRMV